jgi:hypothetical protein
MSAYDVGTKLATTSFTPVGNEADLVEARTRRRACAIMLSDRE